MFGKKYYLIILSLIGLYVGTLQIGFGQQLNNSFESITRQAGIDIEYIKTQPTLSRYEVTRLLNAVECIDCINPGDKLIQTYTNNFWVKFTSLPGKDFDDIIYKKAIYQNKSYYYCVATVADKEYMFGYPALTSPLCPGKFCGTNTMSKGEFVQVVTNILSKYIQKNYTTDWQKIQTRYTRQTPGSYSYNIFNDKDVSIIRNKSAQCTDKNCALGGSSEFHTYLKYCMFNLKECSMVEFGWMTQGYRPIAELNIAIKEGVITNNTSFIDTIHQPIDGKTAIEAFGKIFPKIQCTFDTDYDCDGIANKIDNCPNHYNPTQKDIDGDTIGDVCDDDIDNDTIKNPIGIVDERGSINMRLWTLPMDNCLFIKNTNQQDDNSNYQGNSCDLSAIKGVSIGIKVLGTGENSQLYAYVITDYTSTEDNRKRDIGGKILYGRQIRYPLQKSGKYTVYLQSTTDYRRKASTSFIITIPKTYSAADISLSLSKAYLPTILTTILSTSITPQTTLWTLEGPDNQNKTSTNSLENAFLIRKPGKYILSSTIKNKNNDTLGVSSRSFMITQEQNNINNITISTIEPKIGERVTITTNENTKERQIDRGDGTRETQSKNNISHTYTKDGIYVIQSTITLIDNSTINDYKTIVINNTIPGYNKALQTRPGTLEGITQKSINFNPQRLGYSNKDIISRSFYDGMYFSTGGDDKIGWYTQPGIYYPEHKEVLGVCQYVSNQSTVVINSDLFSCLTMKTKNIQAQCDFDKDGIDDRCDDDIDDDGIQNPIGIITANHSSCDIYQAIFDPNKIKNISCRLDNCPIDSNKDQKDDDRNGKGNICNQLQYQIGENKTENKKMIDTDQDGIPDSNDQCPTLQENYNGNQDTDGCPELGDNNICDAQVLGDSFVGFECLQCPCQYAQESADLNPGDSIRASLRDITGTILQSWSNTKSL